MSGYKKEIQDFLPADELHANDAFVIDQPDALNSVTEAPGVTRKATAALVCEFVAGSGENAAVIDGKITDALAPVNSAISDETAARQNADAALQALIDLGQGKGGALTAHDFGSTAPTQAQLTECACIDIWSAGGAFAYNSATPSASEYAIGGATHAAVEIFNNTWIRNTYNNENHKWVLTNTPDTLPAVYVWTDVGQDVVMGATDAYAGVAKLYNNYNGTNTDGSVTQAQIAVMYGILAGDLLLKLNKAQSSSDAGKALVVGIDGATSPGMPALLANGAADDDAIGDRSLADENADSTLVPVTAKKLLPWLQGIRNNLKWVFDNYSSLLYEFHNGDNRNILAILQLHAGFVGRITVFTKMINTDISLYWDVYVFKTSIKAISHRTGVQQILSYEIDADGNLNVFCIRNGAASYGGAYRVEVMASTWAPLNFDCPYTTLTPIPVVSDGV
jgi:hypothetical protein